MLAAPLAAVPSAPAGAAEVAGVTLTGAEVTATTVTLRGTVTNTGPDPLSQVTVALWRSPELLHSPEAVATALTAETTTPGTARVVEDANRARIAVDTDALAPGETRAFAVSGTLETLGLRAPDATWWAGVDVTGRAGTRRSEPVGSARTLVTKPDAPRPVVTVIGFSAPPRQLKKDLFLDDDLHDEVAGGRLSRLLSTAESTGASWVVDPSLLEELEDMADGYRVRTADGTTAGTGAEAAAAWLARWDQLPTERGASELFGSPDLAGLAALGTEEVPAAIRAVTGATEPDGPARIALLERPDAAALEEAAGFGRPVLVLDGHVPYTRARSGGADVVAVAAEPVVTSPLLPDTPLNRNAARFAVARAAGGEVRWATTPEEATAASGPVPFGFERATLADVLAEPAHEWSPSPPQTPARVALDQPGLERVISLRDRMTAYAAAAPQSGVGGYEDAQTARAASRWWVGDAWGQTTWLAGVERRVALPEGDMVTLDATPRFTMTGDASEFPVTVTNHLQDPITVRVVADTDNPQRIRLLSPDPVTITPGAASTVLLQAESAGGGVVVARVHVQSPDGHRLTPDREIAVETTNYGTIGWVLVVASGLVLVVTTAHRIRQARKQRRGVDG